MKLDIIITHYREPWKTCRYIFDSLSMQRGIPFDDIRVILVNDGDDVVLDEKLFEAYPYYVEYLVKEHGGVSAARNYGINYSDAEYIMLCDCDDGFLNNWGLHMVFSAMQEGFDLLVSNFVEETVTEQEKVMTIISHDQDMTFIHGKVYRREFLLENNIFFDEDMTIHEDGYFNMLAYAEAHHNGILKTVKTPFYLWMWNDQSTVRRDKKDYVLRTYEHVIKTRIGLTKELKRRGFDKDYQYCVAMTVLNCYYDFQKTAFLTAENKKYAAKAEKEFKKYWDIYKNVFMEFTNQFVGEVAKVARENACKNGMMYEQVALKTWLKHIEYEVKI